MAEKRMVDLELDPLEAFSPEKIVKLDDKELGLYVYGIFVAHQAAIRDVSFQQAVEALSRDPSLFDSDTPGVVEFAKVLRLTASGEPERAGKLFRGHFEQGAIVMAALDEAITGRRKNRKNAAKPRSDLLSSHIREVLINDKSLSAKQVIDALDAKGVDVDYDAEQIYFPDSDKGHPFSGIRSRVSREKKKLQKNKSL